MLAKTFRVGVVLAFIGFASACGSAPAPTLVDITFKAAPDVNPDPSGRPSPIFVRYYQLGATTTFTSADYFQLHDSEAKILGPALLDRQELPLAPGASQTVSIEAKPGTTAIGIVAAYRDINNAQWRAQAPVAAGKKTTLEVQLGKLAVSVK